MESETASTKQRGGLMKLVALGAAIVVFIVLSRVFDTREMLSNAVAWVEGLGPLGMAIFVGLYVLACVFMLPGLILTLAAGSVYGVLIGFPLVSVASTLGASVAFLVGRYLARDWVAAKVAGNVRFRAIDEAVASQGWKIVLLTRLSPVFPFNLLNYGYGLTKVPLAHYALASWIGMMPGTLMYVYLGSVGQDLASLGAEGRETTAGEWVLRMVGLAVTIAVTILVTRLAKHALANAVPAAESADA
jgi:uncharacterized membrane protein YdjX (TVP38/TMEM64 family)